MPGDTWQKFANLRLLLAYHATAPGKKLNFMGNEFGQGREWSDNRELDWNLLEYELQRGIKLLARDLNHLYRNHPALHELDFSQEGFQWIDCHDADQSIISFIRRSRHGHVVIVALNFTPVPRENYRIGVPQPGTYVELLNSDSLFYAGSNVNNGSGVTAQNQAWMDQPHSMLIKLPPLASVIFSNNK